MTAKKNDFLFNGIERVTELDLGWDLAHFRAYDPAIGRWLQIDPKTSERESPYVGFANMPNFYIDPLGDTIEYGNYTINNFWDDTYMGRDLQRIGSAAYDATLGKLGDWIDGHDKESTTEKANDWGVTIEGENGAGADSKYSVTANPLENNSIMEQEFLDGFTAGFRALHAPSQNGEFGKATEAVANGVNSTVKAGKEAEKIFNSDSESVKSDTISAKGIYYGDKIYRQDYVITEKDTLLLRREINGEGQLVPNGKSHLEKKQ